MGKTILQFVPVSPQLPPLRAPEADGQVLYHPHDGTFETASTIATQEDVEFLRFWAFPSTDGKLLGLLA
jgi:hypothetical protein